MEPRIQYAKTKDGMSIAYWVAGRGPPIVWVPDPPFSHIQLEWRLPVFRKAFELFAAKGSVVRFDPRGLGLSDRDVDDLSIDSRILDLEAVVDRLGFETFALFAVARGAPLAIVYAARCSQRVSHLVLVTPVVSGMEAMQVPRWQALMKLSNSDWELYLESVGAQLLGLGHEEARRWADWARACATPETGRRYQNAMAGDDVTEYLPRVLAQTLLVHPTGLSFLNLDTVRKLASGIPNAQLITPEGNLQESIELILAAIDDFMGEGEEAVAETPEPGAFRTILFTDVEGSTALTQRLGDAKARDLLREHERIVREALKAHGGSEVKTLGDGFMASFSSATKALECAIAMQRAFAERNRGEGAALAPPQGAASDAPTGPMPTEPLHIRIGLNAGEPIAEDDPDGRADLFGTAVIRAARIAAKAKGGEILASDVVRQLVAGKDFLFADRGEANLKGFDEPVRLYEVRWQVDPAADQA